MWPYDFKRLETEFKRELALSFVTYKQNRYGYEIVSNKGNKYTIVIGDNGLFFVYKRVKNEFVEVVSKEDRITFDHVKLDKMLYLTFLKQLENDEFRATYGFPLDTIGALAWALVNDH